MKINIRASNLPVGARLTASYEYAISLGDRYGDQDSTIDRKHGHGSSIFEMQIDVNSAHSSSTLNQSTPTGPSPSPVTQNIRSKTRSQLQAARYIPASHRVVANRSPSFRRKFPDNLVLSRSNGKNRVPFGIVPTTRRITSEEEAETDEASVIDATPTTEQLSKAQNTVLAKRVAERINATATVATEKKPPLKKTPGNTEITPLEDTLLGAKSTKVSKGLSETATPTLDDEQTLSAKKAALASDNPESSMRMIEPDYAIVEQVVDSAVSPTRSESTCAVDIEEIRRNTGEVSVVSAEELSETIKTLPGTSRNQESVREKETTYSKKKPNRTQNHERSDPKEASPANTNLPSDKKSTMPEKDACLVSHPQAEKITNTAEIISAEKDPVGCQLAETFLDTTKIVSVGKEDVPVKEMTVDFGKKCKIAKRTNTLTRETGMLSKETGAPDESDKEKIELQKGTLDLMDTWTKSTKATKDEQLEIASGQQSTETKEAVTGAGEDLNATENPMAHNGQRLLRLDVLALQKMIEEKKLSKKVSDTSIKTSHAEFENLALKPRGITIKDDQRHVNPFDHFSTNPAPPTGIIAHYKGKKGLQDTSLWLEGNEQFTKDILREYKSMKEFKLCESEYSLYAFENLLKREMRSPDLPEATSWFTERMVEFTTRPGDQHWEPPPIIFKKLTRKDYAFDIRPDCSYWITLQAFDPKHRKNVEDHVLVRDGRILWPYFTIEFKKDGETKKDGATYKTARNQVAAASAIGLYNRWKLKKKARDTTNQSWGLKTVQALRHYGITFVGCNYDIWCVEAKVDAAGTWTGCHMFRLYEDKCSSAEGVNGFINWVNEIHHWGLTVYGPECKRDIMNCIKFVRKG